MIERAFREHWGRVLATLVGFLGDIDLAEEAAQEAFARAAARWPTGGEPEHPAAWLIAVGRNVALDRIRRGKVLDRKARLLEIPETIEDEMDVDDASFPDERLGLIFTCCHPALSLEAQVALTLRTLGGLRRPRSPAPSSWPRRRWRSGWCGPSARSRWPASPTGCRRPEAARSARGVLASST